MRFQHCNAAELDSVILYVGIDIKLFEQISTHTQTNIFVLFRIVFREVRLNNEPIRLIAISTTEYNLFLFTGQSRIANNFYSASVKLNYSASY